ncbi:MAG: thiamine pyrophosphate-dependent enzyme, partial [bacterium]
GRCGFGGGTPVADFALENADLILAAGCTISDMTTYEFTLPVRAEVITVNLDSEQNLPGIALKKALIADAGTFLDGAVTACGYDKAPARSEWFAMFEQPKKMWRQLVENNVNPKKKPLSPGFVCREIAKYMEDGDIVTVGAGMHLLYPMAHIECRAPRTFLSAVNFGAMGFGLAAGIAAKLLKPETKVVTIIGDGDVMMTFQDIETAVREKIPMKMFILNDNAYRVLLFRQKIQFTGRILGTTHGNPDFARLADAFGARGVRLEEPDDVEPAVREAMETEEPTIVDVIIDPEDVAPTNMQAVLRMSQG